MSSRTYPSQFLSLSPKAEGVLLLPASVCPPVRMTKACPRDNMKNICLYCFQHLHGIFIGWISQITWISSVMTIAAHVNLNVCVIDRNSHWHILNSWSQFLPEASFGLRVLSLPSCVCVCVSVNHELVRAIIHQPFKLGSPNLDQRCKRPWLRALLFSGAIDLDLQGQIKL